MSDPFIIYGAPDGQFVPWTPPEPDVTSPGRDFGPAPQQFIRTNPKPPEDKAVLDTFTALYAEIRRLKSRNKKLRRRLEKAGELHAVTAELVGDWHSGEMRAEKAMARLRNFMLGEDDNAEG